MSLQFSIRDLKEQMVCSLVIEMLGVLRFQRHECQRVGIWCIVLWRVLRWAGTEDEMKADPFFQNVAETLGVAKPKEEPLIITNGGRGDN